MAIAFKIGGEFLILPANASVQLEQVNHLLNLNNELTGEFTLPLTVPLNDVNARLLQYVHLPNSPKNTSGISAQMWVDGIPHSTGIIKVEREQGHYNYPLRGTASIYYVFKLGAFWQEIKDKTFRDVNFGGTISYPWHGFITSGPNTGFIGHVTDVMNAVNHTTYDYAFYPVANEQGLAGQLATNCIINCCAPIGSAIIPTRFSPDYTAGTSKLYYNQYSPFPYHRFILERIFATIGWNITGSPLLETTFLKSTLIHGGAIGYQLSAASGSMNVEWDFATLLPKIGLGNYLIALANKFGWWFDFDSNNRTVTVSYRKDILTDRIKTDYTGRTSALYESAISTGKIFRMEHAGATEKLDFTYLIKMGAVNNQYALPTPTASIQNHTYLVRSENSWYTCVVDSSNVASWEKASDNLNNFIPDNSTDAVSTNMQLPGSIFLPMRNTAMSELPQKMVVPLVSVAETEELQTVFYTALYHLQQFTINNVSGVNYNYPFASAAHYAPDGSKVADFPLCWEFPDTDEEGIYELYWKIFLQFIRQFEVVTVDLHWSLADVLNYRYQNTILIRNSEYLISNLKVSLPLTNFSQAELIRVT